MVQAMCLFVKNLSFHLDEEGLNDAFPNATTARIAKFPDTQKPKGVSKLRAIVFELTLPPDY